MKKMSITFKSKSLIIRRLDINLYGDHPPSIRELIDILSSMGLKETTEDFSKESSPGSYGSANTYLLIEGFSKILKFLCTVPFEDVLVGTYSDRAVQERIFHNQRLQIATTISEHQCYCSELKYVEAVSKELTDKIKGEVIGLLSKKTTPFLEKLVLKLNAISERKDSDIWNTPNFLLAYACLSCELNKEKGLRDNNRKIKLFQRSPDEDEQAILSILERFNWVCSNRKVPIEKLQEMYITYTMPAVPQELDEVKTPQSGMKPL